MRENRKGSLLTKTLLIPLKALFLISALYGHVNNFYAKLGSAVRSWMEHLLWRGSPRGKELLKCLRSAELSPPVVCPQISLSINPKTAVTAEATTTICVVARAIDNMISQCDPKRTFQSILVCRRGGTKRRHRKRGSENWHWFSKKPLVDEVRTMFN